MPSVSGRIKEIKQPRGGYLKLSNFDCTYYRDGKLTPSIENIHCNLIGLATDYLTRIEMGSSVYDVFEVAIAGARIAQKHTHEDRPGILAEYLAGIDGLDDTSIVNACKAATFDAWFRSPAFAPRAKQHNEINPDQITIRIIRTLVERCITFFDHYGPIRQDGFSFEPPDADEVMWAKWWMEGGEFGGYTDTVISGEGDFLTEDTMWDLKVTKKRIQSRHTLQLLMYWIMGQHSGQEVFKKITKIGFFNPRDNVVYTMETSKIPKHLIYLVEKTIICYKTCTIDVNDLNFDWII